MSPEAAGPTDPRKPVQILVVGKKGSGKTELAYRFFDSYPGDRIAIDPNGDLKMPDDSMEIVTPISARWPGTAYEEFAEEHGLPAAGGNKRRSTLYFVPDAGDPDYLEEIDRAVGLAFAHRNVACSSPKLTRGPRSGRLRRICEELSATGGTPDLLLFLATPRAR